MNDVVDRRLIEECEMYIVGHKIFVRLKDIPMYLSKKTKDSIRNRYSHSIEVGLSTEYLLNSVSRQLGDGINLNFYSIAKIIGMLHDIGHTAFSHDGEVILNKVLLKASASLDRPVHFNANLNNFRRIEKYALFDLLPMDIRRYAFASLIKRKKELKEYPEYMMFQDDLTYGIMLEEKYLVSKGIEIKNEHNKTILCQAMDIADENRYRVTDIIDSLNIYSKEKLTEILVRTLRSKVRVKDIRKLVSLNIPNLQDFTKKHIDTTSIKELLILLLNQESHAKTEFQNIMNSISMAFNRNFKLSQQGELVPINMEIEALRNDFHKVAAKYLWGSKKVNNIKKPFKHYFETVAEYFITKDFELELIDSSTYRNALAFLENEQHSKEVYKRKKLVLLRNFLGGLTNLKIIELYKSIKLLDFEKKLGYRLEKREKLVQKISVGDFEKKLKKYEERLNIDRH